DRLKAILMLDAGFSCVEVGELLLLDDDTIRRYRNTYLNQGVQVLLNDNNKGTKGFLSVLQLEVLEKHLTEHTYMDSKGIVAWIQKEFNINYTVSGINALLNRLGFVYKKPVLTPCKANVEKQEQFVKQYKELKENLEDQDQLYFMDGVHPQHNTIASYGWIKKGTTKHLKTNNGRKRININGALNLATEELFYVEDERINSQTMITLLKQILDKQLQGKIYIVLDNARYYHSQIVKDFLKEHPRIILKFIPPYSPNLNIIERLWKILKKKVVYNKFYLKFQDFRKKIIEFLENQSWKEKEFENILTDKFQIIKPNFSHSYLN
ncbi:MAG: IS630 family transposase, partial [Polaribacter sp.]